MASCLHLKLLHQNTNNSKHSRNYPVTFYCDEASISVTVSYHRTTGLCTTVMASLSLSVTTNSHYLHFSLHHDHGEVGGDSAGGCVSGKTL